MRLLVFCVAAMAAAHHSTAPYDMQNETAVTGSVTRFYWGNPHSYIYMDAADRHWTLEIESPNLLRHLGWTKDSLKPGDSVTCRGARAKDPERFEMKCFWIVMPDGRTLPSQYRGEAPRGK